MALGLVQEASVNVAKLLDRSPEGWDKELSRRWQLAPRDKVRRKEVNQKNYAAECDRLGTLGAAAVLAALSGQLMLQLGIGKFREKTRKLNFVEKINQQGTSIAACDWSKVACRNGRTVFENAPKISGTRNRVHRVNVEEMFQTYNSEETFVKLPTEKDAAALADLQNAELIYAPQFVQVLDEVGMHVVMAGFGKWLAERPGRKVIMVHAFEDDNPAVDWGYTTPYKLNQLIVPANAAAKQKLLVSDLDNKGMFYHHIYTAFTISATAK